MLGMNREVWTKGQKEILTKSFQANVYPERKEVLQLVTSFNVTKKRVENWFSFMRRKKKEMGTLMNTEGE